MIIRPSESGWMAIASFIEEVLLFMVNDISNDAANLGDTIL